MQEPLTLYKLMILYILDSVNGPVKKTLACECIIEQNYTDYLTAQTAIAELSEGNFIRSYTEGDCTWLIIEPDGAKTLSLFLGSLNEEIRKDLTNYLKSKNQDMRNDSSVISNYKRSPNGEFEAHLIARDRGNTLAELTLIVPDEEIASNICKNWKKNSAEIYSYLTEKLF